MCRKHDCRGDHAIASYPFRKDRCSNASLLETLLEVDWIGWKGKLRRENQMFLDGGEQIVDS